MVHFCFHRVQSSRLFLTTSPLTNANRPWINICTGGENLPRWVHDPDWCLEMYTLPSILLCFYRAAVHEDVMTWKRFLYYWLFVREIRLGPTIYLWFVAFTNIVLFINHIWYIYIYRYINQALSGFLKKFPELFHNNEFIDEKVLLCQTKYSTVLLWHGQS